MPAAGAAAPLENTYWKLIRLGDSPVHVASGKREPHLVLDSESRRVAGAGGCNRLAGSYKLIGGQLTFTQMPHDGLHGRMDTEKAFLDALREVKKWKIEGQQLELSDGGGKLVTRFVRRD